MDHRKILLVNLVKGRIGADDANILGSLLVTGFQLAALRRSSTPEEERVPFFCYLDEFHSFTTQSFASILSESRKYKFGITLAGQYLDQMHPDIKSAVFGNCGNLCSFRVEEEDARQMAAITDYPAHIIKDFGTGQGAVKYLKHGHPTTARVTTAQPNPAFKRNQAHRVIAYSNSRYTTPTDLINERVYRFMGNRIYGSVKQKRINYQTKS